MAVLCFLVQRCCTCASSLTGEPRHRDLHPCMHVQDHPRHVTSATSAFWATVTLQRTPHARLQCEQNPSSTQLTTGPQCRNNIRFVCDRSTSPRLPFHAPTSMTSRQTPPGRKRVGVTRALTRDEEAQHRIIRKVAGSWKGSSVTEPYSNPRS